MMKWQSVDSGMLKDLVVGIVGTVLGVFMTVGVTFCSERSAKQEMARKTVMLTIHNIDASIGGMSRLVDELNSQDSLFRYVKAHETSLGKVSTDTLGMFVSAIYARHVLPLDTSTESIFSTNFEVWRYLDDPRVIGRIANCYSIMRNCADEYARVEREKYDAFIRFYDSDDNRCPDSDEEVARELLYRKDIIRIMEALPAETALMKQMIDNARALNDLNKSELGIAQQELDKIGELL